jgi:lysyl-tRNA synthetase class 2
VATEAEILAARRERARALAARGTTLFPARVPRPLDRVADVRQRWDGADADELDREAPSARVAGRLVGIRSFGKAAFAVLQADGVRLQVWMRRDLLGDDGFETFRLYEVGDFMWAAGPLIRTKKGELSVEVREFGFLAKSYRPLPEKFHGLQDVEARYRQRYLDLLVNPGSRELAVARSRAISACRSVLDERGFLEVETPILQPIYGGAAARPFTTYHNVYDSELYLRISFELYLKRLVIGGIDRVYEIGRDFRNEGVDRTHNPEFTMLEAYQAYADYSDMMELTESLVAAAAQRINGSTLVEWKGRTIDLRPPWPRRSMSELVREACGIDIEEAGTLEALTRAVKASDLGDVNLEGAKTWARLVDEIFTVAVEPSLVEPTFVIDYPAELSPLAKRSDESPRFVERFEAYLARMEICNAFSELNDPDDQRERFREQASMHAAGDEDAHPIDEDFVLALEHGMPPCGGLGLGLGRLIMVLTGSAHLREVLLFPYMRRQND